MDGLAVLDLYAGTGALALEALSRGAASAVLVENDARACGVIFHNLSALNYGDRSRMVRAGLPEALRELRGERFDLVFSDPPYALRAAQPTLEALASNGLLAPGARVVLETDRREPVPMPPLGLTLTDERRYGDTRVLIFSAE
jgi:16S rRNA (guanine(966)-N(2))-methyltransferase RsmD